MNKARVKKLCSFLLALTVMMTTVLICAEPVMAAGETVVDLYQSEQEEKAAAGVETKIPFQVPGGGQVYFSLVVDHVSNLTVALYDQEGNPVAGLENPHPVTADSFTENADHKFTYTENWTLVEGSYTWGLTWIEDTVYTAGVYTKLPNASISKKKISITAGFSKTLSVSGAEVKSWTSQKRSIAVVDKNGKVTGKKSGKTTITATLEDGRKLTCAVTVYKNMYTDKKGTVDMVKSGKVVPQPYQAYYDSKGNLKVKVNFINTTSKNVIALTDLKITVKDKNKKVVGAGSLTYQSVQIPTYTAKSLTYTIPKSEVNQKVDLRSAAIYVNGHYQGSLRGRNG